jgi:hypothetical protein
LEYVYKFFIDGVISILRRWLNKENKEEPEEISNIITTISKKVFDEVYLI